MSAAAPPKQKVLVVEDEFVRESMRMALEWSDYTVDCAADGQQALDHLRESDPPSLILLDLMMPVLDGWQFRRQQRQDPALAGIPVVVVSASANEAGGADPLDADAYLQKPVTLDHLLATVRHYVRAESAGG
jgi:CheY-like chemotaxis protein